MTTPARTTTNHTPKTTVSTQPAFQPGRIAARGRRHSPPSLHASSSNTQTGCPRAAHRPQSWPPPVCASDSGPTGQDPPRRAPPRGLCVRFRVHPPGSDPQNPDSDRRVEDTSRGVPERHIQDSRADLSGERCGTLCRAHHAGSVTRSASVRAVRACRSVRGGSLRRRAGVWRNCATHRCRLPDQRLW